MFMFVVFLLIFQIGLAGIQITLKPLVRSNIFWAFAGVHFVAIIVTIVVLIILL